MTEPIAWDDIVKTYKRLGEEARKPRADRMVCGTLIPDFLFSRYRTAEPGNMLLSLPFAGIPVLVDEDMEPHAWRVDDQYGNVLAEGIVSGA